MATFDRAQKLDSAHARHANVGDQDLRAVVLELVQHVLCNPELRRAGFPRKRFLEDPTLSTSSSTIQIGFTAGYQDAKIGGLVGCPLR
jgi:hypothetical protein